MIDHIDGNRANNTINNLRDVNRSVNLQNQRHPSSNNKSGFLGVSFHNQRKKFQARIRLHGKDKHLGLFQTPELAHQAYLAAKRIHHEGCTI